MLSILIPVYNFDVTAFIYELHKQATKTQNKFEIIIADDCSSTKYRQINGVLEELSNLTYYHLNINIGRSKIRNFLAEEASYQHLLFTDCDSKIPKEDYILSFMNECKGSKVVCGGRIYAETSPMNKDFVLRWKYGNARETANAKERNEVPNQSFMTNNFLISKSILSKIQFDESLTNYGHEDTLFGYELANEKITIKHIENPLVHIGLETADQFLKKTEHGVKNLKYISEHYDYPKLRSDIKLLRVYQKVKFLSPLFKLSFFILRPRIEKMLKNENPSLKVFDFYKLSLLFSKNK